MPLSEWTILEGDCKQQLLALDDDSVDAVVTDPPYELGFMNKAWDSSGVAFEPSLWAEVLRVVKPGGHLLAFSGTRTYHRMAVAIEDAGWQIRDQLAWVYGSGFPKSLNIQKATQDDQWEGWGTALKPAWEPIVLARKPLHGTVANNIQQWGTGGLNIDGCRVEGGPSPSIDRRKSGAPKMEASMFRNANHKHDREAYERNRPGEHIGRWPANLLHDGSQMVLDLFPGQGDQSASRFFYCPKAGKSERELGLDALDDRILNRTNPGGLEQDPKWAPRIRKNNHPTVKPVALMRYLVRLVTPPGGLVLDPFTGSGTTGVAAIREGFRFIGCEMNQDYLDIIRARLQAAR